MCVTINPQLCLYSTCPCKKVLLPLALLPLLEQQLNGRLVCMQQLISTLKLTKHSFQRHTVYISPQVMIQLKGVLCGQGRWVPCSWLVCTWCSFERVSNTCNNSNTCIMHTLEHPYTQTPMHSNTASTPPSHTPHLPTHLDAYQVSFRSHPHSPLLLCLAQPPPTHSYTGHIMLVVVLPGPVVKKGEEQVSKALGVVGPIPLKAACIAKHHLPFSHTPVRKQGGGMMGVGYDGCGV